MAAAPPAVALLRLQILIKRLSDSFSVLHELHFLFYHVVNLMRDVLLMCYMKQHLCCEVVHKTIKTWFS